MNNQNKIVNRDQEIQEAAHRLDQLMIEAAEFSGVIDIGRSFTASLKMARVVRELHECIRPVISELMPLMNTSLGFKTDKDPSKKSRQKDGTYEYASPYTEEQVIPVIAESIIRGVRVTGNQFNIISAGCYITKEGFAQKLSDLSDFHNFEEDFLFDKNQNFEDILTCVVKYSSKWTYKGNAGELVRYIPVRLNKGMGPDAAIGKAERKGRKAVWQRVTNIWVPDGDAGEFETVGGVEIQRPKFANEKKANVQEPVVPPTQPSAQQLDANVGAIIDRVMDSGIDPRFFVDAFIENNLLAVGQSLSDISPAFAKAALKGDSWAKIYTAAKRLEGGAK